MINAFLDAKGKIWMEQLSLPEQGAMVRILPLEGKKSKHVWLAPDTLLPSQLRDISTRNWTLIMHALRSWERDTKIASVIRETRTHLQPVTPDKRLAALSRLLKQIMQPTVIAVFDLLSERPVFVLRPIQSHDKKVEIQQLPDVLSSAPQALTLFLYHLETAIQQAELLQQDQLEMTQAWSPAELKLHATIPYSEMPSSPLSPDLLEVGRKRVKRGR